MADSSAAVAAAVPPRSVRLSKFVLANAVIKSLVQGHQRRRPDLVELLCYVAASPEVAVNLDDLADYHTLIRSVLWRWNQQLCQSLPWAVASSSAKASNPSAQNGTSSGGDENGGVAGTGTRVGGVGSPSGSPSMTSETPPRLMPQSSLPSTFSAQATFRTTDTFYHFDLDAALFADESEKGIIQYTRGVAWSSMPGFSFLTWMRVPSAVQINELLSRVRSNPGGRNLATRPRLVELPTGLDPLSSASLTTQGGGMMRSPPSDRGGEYGYPAKYVKFCLLHLLSKSRPPGFDRSPGLRVSLLRRFDVRTWRVGDACLLLVEADDSSLTAQDALDRRQSGGGSVRTLLSLYELGALNDGKWHHFGLSHANPMMPQHHQHHGRRQSQNQSHGHPARSQSQSQRHDHDLSLIHI